MRHRGTRGDAAPGRMPGPDGGHQNGLMPGIESAPGVETTVPDTTSEAAPPSSPASWRQVNPWLIGIIAAITFYVAYFTKRTLDTHHGLGTSSYDFGLYDQGVWLMSRFH